MIGSKLFQSLAILDPTTLTWSNVEAIDKTDAFNSEEGWALLPDGSVFTLDVHNAPSSERFLLTGPNQGLWVSSGHTIDDLHTPSASGPLNAPGCTTYYPPGEVGPVLLMPSGNIFAVGASGYTGIYTPPGFRSLQTGSWARGPQLPSGLNVADGPGALLPSGHVLFGASPGISHPGLQYFEFDGTNLNSVPAPLNAPNDATYYTSLLVLPTGQVMFSDFSQTVQIYTPASLPQYQSSWAPEILLVPDQVDKSDTYVIAGKQFNGLSQGSAYGDEYQNATNYPLVRITNKNTGHVVYARTHDHSSMGVATGNQLISTRFDVPASIEDGPSTIEVVANGIPSQPVNISIREDPDPDFKNIVFNPQNANFGNIGVGTSSRSILFTATNNSNAIATFSSGSNLSHFNIQGGSCGSIGPATTLAPGAYCTFSATFSPTAMGLVIGSFNLSTATYAATFQLKGNGVYPRVVFNPPMAAFGNVKVGTTSAPITISVGNYTGSAATYQSFSNLGSFNFSPGTCGAISPGTMLQGGDFCQLQVSFSPTAASPDNGNFTINTAAGLLTYKLSGTGTP